jgi:hypothetical protein
MAGQSFQAYLRDTHDVAVRSQFSYSLESRF